MLYAWHWGKCGAKSFVMLGLCLAVAVSGMLIFMGYCASTFGDPLAFMRNRTDLWRLRARLPILDKAQLLLLLEPLWSLFVPGSESYWGRLLTSNQVWWNTYPLGPLYFVGALTLVAVGIWNGRLNRYETTLALGLILIPYWLVGYDIAMVSMARYLSVIPPLFSYGGLLLARAPKPLVAVAAGLGGVLMAIYAAQFAQGHWLI
jgi:hypothetical protein